MSDEVQKLRDRIAELEAKLKAERGEVGLPGWKWDAGEWWLKSERYTAFVKRGTWDLWDQVLKRYWDEWLDRGAEGEDPSGEWDHTGTCSSYLDGMRQAEKKIRELEESAR